VAVTSTDDGVDADADAAFRGEVRALLDETADEREPRQYFMDRSGPTADLYRRLGERGWLAVSWPVWAGGKGLPARREFALWDELALAGAARPSVAAGLIARSIIGAGSAQQRAWLLPGIAAGRTGFALGYSEPEAGSDLSALRTRAVRDGARYVVSGEKRWTSDAHTADFLWLLARTGELSERSRALTLLVVPLDAAGVLVSPIQTLDGHRLNEVRLQEVEVSVANRIGVEGGAWNIIQAALARERHLQVLPGRIRRDYNQLCSWAHESGAYEGPDVRRALARFRGWLDVVAATAAVIVRNVDLDIDTTVISARQKIVGISLMQAMARFPLEWGDQSQLCAGADFEFAWRECVMESIAGGTTEMMHGILARRALGLRG
jgi:alkylation response protein AidB-like acyl-CoA dehydrogenase